MTYPTSSSAPHKASVGVGTTWSAVGLTSSIHPGCVYVSLWVCFPLAYYSEGDLCQLTLLTSVSPSPPSLHFPLPAPFSTSLPLLTSFEFMKSSRKRNILQRRFGWWDEGRWKAKAASWINVISGRVCRCWACCCRSDFDPHSAQNRSAHDGCTPADQMRVLLLASQEDQRAFIRVRVILHQWAIKRAGKRQREGKWWQIGFNVLGREMKKAAPSAESSFSAAFCVLPQPGSLFFLPPPCLLSPSPAFHLFLLFSPTVQ